MSDMSSMNRERKKRELKRQMISTPGQAQAIQEEQAQQEEQQQQEEQTAQTEPAA